MSLVVSNSQGDTFEITLDEFIESINRVKTGDPVDTYDYEKYVYLSEYTILEYL